MEEKNSVEVEAKKFNFWQTSLFKSREIAAVLETPSVMFSSSSCLHAFQTVNLSSECRALSLFSDTFEFSWGVFQRLFGVFLFVLKKS